MKLFGATLCCSLFVCLFDFLSAAAPPPPPSYFENYAAVNVAGPNINYDATWPTLMANAVNGQVLGSPDADLKSAAIRTLKYCGIQNQPRQFADLLQLKVNDQRCKDALAILTLNFNYNSATLIANSSLSRPARFYLNLLYGIKCIKDNEPHRARAFFEEQFSQADIELDKEAHRDLVNLTRLVGQYRFTRLSGADGLTLKQLAVELNDPHVYDSRHPNTKFADLPQAKAALKTKLQEAINDAANNKSNEIFYAIFIAPKSSLPAFSQAEIDSIFGKMQNPSEIDLFILAKKLLGQNLTAPNNYSARINLIVGDPNNQLAAITDQSYFYRAITGTPVEAYDDIFHEMNLAEYTRVRDFLYNHYQQNGANAAERYKTLSVLAASKSFHVPGNTRPDVPASCIGVREVFFEAFQNPESYVGKYLRTDVDIMGCFVEAYNPGAIARNTNWYLRFFYTFGVEVTRAVATRTVAGHVDNHNLINPGFPSEEVIIAAKHTAIATQAATAEGILPVLLNNQLPYTAAHVTAFFDAIVVDAARFVNAINGFTSDSVRKLMRYEAVHYIAADIAANHAAIAADLARARRLITIVYNLFAYDQARQIANFRNAVEIINQAAAVHDIPDAIAADHAAHANYAIEHVYYLIESAEKSVRAGGNLNDYMTFFNVFNGGIWAVANLPYNKLADFRIHAWATNAGNNAHAAFAAAGNFANNAAGLYQRIRDVTYNFARNAGYLHVLAQNANRNNPGGVAITDDIRRGLAGISSEDLRAFIAAVVVANAVVPQAFWDYCVNLLITHNPALLYYFFGVAGAHGYTIATVQHPQFAERAIRDRRIFEILHYYKIFDNIYATDVIRNSVSQESFYAAIVNRPMLALPLDNFYDHIKDNTPVVGGAPAGTRTRLAQSMLYLQAPFNNNEPVNGYKFSFLLPEPGVANAGDEFSCRLLARTHEVSAKAAKYSYKIMQYAVLTINANTDISVWGNFSDLYKNAMQIALRPVRMAPVPANLIDDFYNANSNVNMNNNNNLQRTVTLRNEAIAYVAAYPSIKNGEDFWSFLRALALSVRLNHALDHANALKLAYQGIRKYFGAYIDDLLSTGYLPQRTAGNANARAPYFFADANEATQVGTYVITYLRSISKFLLSSIAGRGQAPFAAPVAVPVPVVPGNFAPLNPQQPMFGYPPVPGYPPYNYHGYDDSTSGTYSSTRSSRDGSSSTSDDDATRTESQFILDAATSPNQQVPATMSKKSADDSAGSRLSVSGIYAVIVALIVSAASVLFVF